MVLAWYNKNINKDEGLDGCGGASCFHLWCPCLWSVSGCMAAVHNSAWEVQKRKKRIHHFNIYYFESLAGNLVVPDWFHSVLNNDSGTVWTNFGVNVYVLQVLIVYQIPKGSFSLGRGGGHLCRRQMLKTMMEKAESKWSTSFCIWSLQGSLLWDWMKQTDDMKDSCLWDPHLKE